MMAMNRYYVLDPHDLEARFSSEDGMAFMASIFTEPSEEALIQMERIREVIEVLPPLEADFIELYYFFGCKQTDIAEIFSVSQPTVCYRLQRAASRIKYLMEIPALTEDELRDDLTGVLKSPDDVDILWLMYRTTCQSAAAQRLGVTQGLVRHRFLRSLTILKNKPGLEKYAKAFDMVLNNLNILRDMNNPTSDPVPCQLVVR